MPFAALPDGAIGLNPAAGMYGPMADTLRAAGARFLLLVGDQIYADQLPGIGVRERFPEPHVPSLVKALDAYRLVYRGYFAQEGIRRLRETLSTLCMWDDHDILNDWGSMISTSPLEQRLFEAATRTYCEYQHLRNPDGCFGAPPFGYTFAPGDAGFLVLDLRGDRDYESGQLLGRAQWEAVRAYLTGEAIRRVTTLFVVSSVPVAHVSRWFVRLFEAWPGERRSSVRDRWCSRHFAGARDELLRELMLWQQKRPGRQVVLLSGDVHAAGAYTIRARNGRGVVQQLTSSPLSTQAGAQQKMLLALASRAPNLFEPRWRFTRRLTTYANNFGLVRLTPLPAGGHHVEFSVHAWLPGQQRLFRAGVLVCAPEA
jgi:phosphodiesterase/alkaline phosphatase D-like protein